MSKEGKTNKLLEKLKNVKHIEIYIAVIFIVVLLLIFMSSKKSNTQASQSKFSSSNEQTVTAYVENMEGKLTQVLSSINGISEVNVMITLDMKTAEIVDSKITLEYFPDIKGILITAKGLNNTGLKMKVLSAVESVLDVKNGNISLLSSD